MPNKAEINFMNGVAMVLAKDGFIKAPLYISKWYKITVSDTHIVRHTGKWINISASSEYITMYTAKSSGFSPDTFDLMPLCNDIYVTMGKSSIDSCGFILYASFVKGSSLKYIAPYTNRKENNSTLAIKYSRTVPIYTGGYLGSLSREYTFNYDQVYFDDTTNNISANKKAINDFYGTIENITYTINTMNPPKVGDEYMGSTVIKVEEVSKPNE